MLAVLACQAALAACGRSSKPDAEPGPPGGAAAEAGRGTGGAGTSGAGAGFGGSATAGSGSAQGGDGATGTGGTTGGGAGSVAGSAGAFTGVAGTGGGPTPSAGAGGSSGDAASGGFGADVLGTAGDGAGGTAGANDCQNLCAPGAPACCTPGLECVTHVPSCRIDVLVGRVDTVYEYSELEEKVAPLTDVAFTIADTDVEWALAEEPLAKRIELHLSREASQAHFDALTSSEASTQPFRFICDGQTLFVGVIYLIYGAAALQTPVLHVDDVDHDALVLKLGAWQAAWLLKDAVGPDELRALIDRPELRATFCARSALKVLEDD